MFDKARAAIGRVQLNVFGLVEHLLTLAALTLVAVTVGGQVGQMLGLEGTVGTVAAWSIAVVFDALWIGSLRMSEQAIRQRSTVGMAVMFTLSAAAVATSTVTLLLLGHAKVFAFVPVAAAVFMGLRLFVDNVLADAATSQQIAAQSAADRNARALAAAGARHLRSEAVTDVLTETAGHLAEAHRQVARAEVLTAAQVQVDKARAAAEKRLAKADTKHGEAAQAFAARRLAAAALPAVERDGHGGHTVDTQVKPEIEGATDPAVTAEQDGTVPAGGMGVTLAELSVVAGVDEPQPGATLTDAQLAVVLRWLRYGLEPPRSYRQARQAFRDAGYVAREERVRRVWGEIETREATVRP